MSVKNCVDKTTTALKMGKNKTVGLYNFLKSISVKNKACFDLQIKSDKCFVPLWKRGFSYNKEWRIMPLVWIVMGILTVLAFMKSLMSKD